jgi:MATE family multidrug resistance protein
MTSLEKIGRGPVAVATSGNHLALELTETLKLAVPMALTQLGQIAMMTTDLALIGRLGDEAVAAAALAHTVFFVCFTFGMGLMSAVAPLAAQAFGARNPRWVRRSLRVGLWAGLLISLPMMAFPLYGEQILVLLGQAPATAHLAQQYLFGLAWGITPSLWFLAIRGFMGAVNRPEPGLWITLAAIPANGVLVYLLIHGALGLPRLELFGAGLGSTIIDFGMLLAALWIAYRRRPFRKYRVLAHVWRIDWALMRQLIVIGGPISVAFLMEYGLFAAAALLMGLIGTTALAAHQIALQVTAILFMVPFGIGMAATVRVGHAVGRNDPAAVKRAGFVATLLGIVLVSVLTLAVIVGRYAVARFLRRGCGERWRRRRSHRDAVGGRCDVLCRRRHPDGRGRRAAWPERHAVPLVFAAISYWLIGFTAAYGLAFRAGFGAVGVWIGLSCGTAVYAILLVLRFRRLAGHLALAATAESWR